MSGVNIKVSPNCCPESTDRVCQVVGALDAVMLATKEIYERVDKTTVKGQQWQYDPENCNPGMAWDYLGFEGEGKRSGGGGRG